MKQGLKLIDSRAYLQAYECFEKLLKKDKTHPDVRYFYAVMAFHTKHTDEAIAVLEEDSGWNPETGFTKPFATTPKRVPMYHTPYDRLYFLGLTYHDAGRFKDACRVLGELARRDDLPTEIKKKTYAMLGRSLMSACESRKAVDLLNKALEIDPECAVTWTNLANVTMSLDQLDESALAHEKAITFCQRDGDPTAQIPRLKRSLAMLYKRLGREAECQSLYQELFNDSPSYGLIMEQALYLPNIYPSLDSVGEYRKRFVGNVAAMVNDTPVMPNIESEVNCPPAFLLAYQGENDKAIHGGLGQLIAKSIRPEPYAPRKRNQKIRVGIISRFFVRNHTIGKLYCGLFENLNPDEFDVYVFQVAPKFHPKAHKGWVKEGNITRGFIPETNQALARKIIEHAELDVAFYTDIGMDITTYFLAFHRLAPVQCVTFGHPVTTGIPNMDYFISSVDMEPDDADDHYTEQLVCLNHIPTFYAKPDNTGKYSRADFGFTDEDNLYICPQSLFKMHPEYDFIFKGILENDPKGKIALLDGATKIWQEQLMERLTQTVGPDILDRLVFLPRMPREKLIGLMAAADVMLDPIHFGGGNTSLEAFAVGTPIVTWPGGYMRSRVTSAALKAMGVEGLIVPTHQAYIDKAVELATNPVERQRVSQQILERCDVLFENNDAVRELEVFFKLAVEEAERQGYYLPDEAPSLLSSGQL